MSFTFENVAVDGPSGPMVKDLYGTVPAAGVTAIVGPSGAGKSTLLRLCNRLTAPSRGVVRLDGVDIATLDPLALRRRVGMVFQRPTPFGGSVLDNLLVADPRLDARGATRLLERVALDGSFLDRPASQLSGGECQRVCMARTLATSPTVLLMDEPTSSVDPRARATLEDLARGEARAGTPVLWVTHDLQQMRRLADFVIVVLKGEIAYAAAVSCIEADAPAAVKAFLTSDGDA